MMERGKLRYPVIEWWTASGAEKLHFNLPLLLNSINIVSL